MTEFYSNSNHNKEKKGYELIEDITLSCSNCGKPLVSIAKISEKQRTALKKYKAKCGYCNDYSWNKTITGTICLSGIEGKTVISNTTMEYDDKGEPTLCIIEVQPCK